MVAPRPWRKRRNDFPGWSRRVRGGGVSLLWCAGPGRRRRFGDPEERQELLADVPPVVTKDFSNGRRTVLKISKAAPRWSARRSPRLDGRELDAERLYEQAIRSARANGFVHIEALANELAGRFYGARGFETSARAYLEGPALLSALGSRRQGAATRWPLSAPRAGRTLLESRPTISEHIEHLELATVLNALQAVSGEIVPERLIETLLRMSLEHAGAERGVLLLPGEGGLLMRAEATSDRGTLTVRLRETGRADDLAESVVQYVARTQERHSERCLGAEPVLWR